MASSLKAKVVFMELDTPQQEHYAAPSAAAMLDAVLADFPTAIPLDRESICPDFGRYRGVPLTRIPGGYLRWLYNTVGIPLDWRELAGAELARRGTAVPVVEVTAHAVDRASQRALDVWLTTRHGTEGLHSWLTRMVLEALDRGTYGQGDCRIYNGLAWYIEPGEEYPVLKTVAWVRQGDGGA